MEKKKILKTLGLSLVAAGTIAVGAFLGGKEVEAASILEAPNLTVPTANDSVSSKYSFIAQFNEEKTKPVTFGNGWRELSDDGSLKEQGYSSKVAVFNPSEQTNPDSYKGKNGIRYPYVGNYEGKELDLKITIKNWTAPASGNHYGNIMFGLDSISVNTQDYKFVDMDWEFVERGTDKPVKVSGFMSINDVDATQCVKFGKNTSSKISNIYVSSNENKISFDNVDGEYMFYDGIGVFAEPNDLNHTFTFTYDESSKLEISWGNRNREGVISSDLRPNAIAGDFFGYIAKKPLKTETLKPVKKNSDSDETLVDLNTLKDRNESMSYTIVHQVPDEYSDYYYKSYVFEDTLNDVFEIESMSIKDQEGTNRENYFDIATKGNAVKYAAKSSVLKTAAFYGNYYYTTINAKIRKDADLSVLADKNIVVIPNQAKISIDGNSNSSNKTETIVKFSPKIPTPEKRVLNEKGEDINAQKVERGETIYYEKDQKVNVLNKDIVSKYTKFEIVDSLPNNVKFISAVVLINGKEVDVKVIDYNESTHTVSFVADSAALKAMKMNGETYTLRSKVMVIDEVADNELIKNVASTVVNDTEQKTNEVTNNVKLPKGSITIHKVTSQVVGISTNVESALSKTNVGFAGLFFTEAFADENSDNGLIWEKLPQKDVTYEVKANENITFPDGSIVFEKGHDFGTVTTDEAGKATIENLYAGDYVFVEVAAPLGIQVDPTPIIVSLAAENNGKEMTASGNQEDPLQEVKITIPKLFEQEDGSFEKDSGAVFGLYHAKDFVIDAENVIKADTLVSEIEIKDGIGSYQAAMVRNQQYYIKEISTKEGYQLDSKQYVFSYVPSSNEAVHEFELYDNGYLESGVFKEYETVKTDTEEENVEAIPETEEEGTGEEQETPELVEIKNLLIHDDSIVKSILKEDGTRVEHYDILEDGEKITFEGQIYIGDHEKVELLKLSDKLPDGFELDAMRVYDESGEDITKHTDYEVNGQDVAIIVKQDYAEKMKRTKISWILETIYHYSEDHKGKTFENQMVLTVNDDEIQSNVVTLTPPVIEVVETPETVEKPTGSFPQTGEEIQRWATVIGAVIFLGAISFWYTRKIKQTEEIDKTE